MRSGCRFFSSWNRVRDVLAKGVTNEKLVVKGWVQAVRRQKNVCFVELNDGSCAQNLQIVTAPGTSVYVGASVEAIGLLEGRTLKDKSTQFELQAASFNVVGSVPEDYPLQRKNNPSEELLRELAHLRPRTPEFAAVMRVRNAAAQALHAHLQGQGLIEVNAPIMVSSDCEGAGELFSVSAGEDFFGASKKAYLTVSAQLHGEAFACSMGKVYVFGPTFRAEQHSKTAHHLAEFWMLEPEIAFADLDEAVQLAESTVRGGLQGVAARSADDIRLLKFKQPEDLVKLASQSFARMTYTEAIEQLQKSGTAPVSWGDDLRREHERWLCEKFTGGVPVFVTHYPASLKPFYAKQSRPAAEQKDGVAEAFDLLVPGIGELIGGSVREDSYEKLLSILKNRGMDAEKYDWYLDLRKYGSVPHAGFGMGFERFLQFCTGVPNIRDVTPMPRWSGWIRM